MFSSHRHLGFNLKIGARKPETIIHQDAKCPFCDRDCLEDIIDEQGKILLIKNKYPVLQDAFQTILIETDDCHGDLSTYPREHLYAVIRFGVEWWFRMSSDPEYASVIFYKNFGPMSGGTMRHPHMQIVGLKNIDYREFVPEDCFRGVPIFREEGVEFNLSTAPKIGFFEFNVIIKELIYLEKMAEFIKITTHYLLNHFFRDCHSYNLFFYHLEGRIIAKIMPRFVTSPLFVGYSIPQVSTRQDHIVSEIRDRYLRENAESGLCHYSL
ncbi:MAG TPA: DUF4931 domain-containing protein [Patescibacteria group bacterium]|nr:DUF4931 domain-containing protein [Patescibacteria group bacterium]